MSIINKFELEKVLTPKIVTDCYDVCSASILAGFEDYTEGIYNGNRFTSYEDAQNNQYNYILDELGVNKGFKLLDVGCGNGTLLKAALNRGAKAIGITISPNQFEYCKSKGLNVHLLNYKNISKEYENSFDGIVANGSLEHFCQPQDAINGNQNKIYEEMFEIFSRILNPKSDCKKVVTTSIHFREKHFDIKRLFENPIKQFILDKEAFHFSAILYRGLGGYYPTYGQLEKCASDYFNLIKEVDGTEDYHFTSEDWRNKIKKHFWNDKKFIKCLWNHFKKKPYSTFWFSLSFYGLDSWPWQFRGENPPTRLYRHTWKKVQ